MKLHGYIALSVQGQFTKGLSVYNIVMSLTVKSHIFTEELLKGAMSVLQQGKVFTLFRFESSLQGDTRQLYVCITVVHGNMQVTKVFFSVEQTQPATSVRIMCSSKAHQVYTIIEHVNLRLILINYIDEKSFWQKGIYCYEKC